MCIGRGGSEVYTSLLINEVVILNPGKCHCQSMYFVNVDSEGLNIKCLVNIECTFFLGGARNFIE